jgi:hypothetical protein
VVGSYLEQVDSASENVLHELHGGVFAAVLTVAGTIFFRERLAQYEYHHFTNSLATLSSQIIRCS